jgi:hypothetical protein
MIKDEIFLKNLWLTTDDKHIPITDKITKGSSTEHYYSLMYNDAHTIYKCNFDKKFNCLVYTHLF